jgi:hypothetical protein
VKSADRSLPSLRARGGHATDSSRVGTDEPNSGAYRSRVVQKLTHWWVLPTGTPALASRASRSSTERVVQKMTQPSDLDTLSRSPPVIIMRAATASEPTMPSVENLPAGQDPVERSHRSM